MVDTRRTEIIYDVDYLFITRAPVGFQKDSLVEAVHQQILDGGRQLVRRHQLHAGTTRALPLPKRVHLDLRIALDETTTPETVGPLATGATHTIPANNGEVTYNCAGTTLSIAKTPDNQSVVEGGSASFTITVTNTGNLPLDITGASTTGSPDFGVVPVALVVACLLLVGGSQLGCGPARALRMRVSNPRYCGVMPASLSM